jgi:hypothetical protein
VIAQAVKDATPEAERGGRGFRDDIRRRRLQCESLMWLCGTDPDLQYWSMLADYPLRNLHLRFRPMLRQFILHHPTVAESFSLPEWLRECA